MADVLFFIIAFGFFGILGLSVAFIADNEETEKSKRIRDEFLKQFDK